MMTPLGLTDRATLKPLDPLGLGDASSGGGLSREQALATGANSHYGRDQDGVQDMVDLRAVCQCCGQIPLKGFQLGPQGTDAAIELAVGE
jgi:hypothetical protein